MSNPWIYVFLNGFDGVRAMQCAFETDDWTLVAGIWDCTSNPAVGHQPVNPLGPGPGTLAIAFDVVMGPQFLVIGRMLFVPPTSGCLTVVESIYGSGGCVVLAPDGSTLTDVPAENRGVVCAGQGGYDACDPPVPVDAVTWGSIKAQYR
jgi:hypothetical protein